MRFGGKEGRREGRKTGRKERRKRGADLFEGSFFLDLSVENLHAFRRVFVSCKEGRKEGKGREGKGRKEGKKEGMRGRNERKEWE